MEDEFLTKLDRKILENQLLYDRYESQCSRKRNINATVMALRMARNLYLETRHAEV